LVPAFAPLTFHWYDGVVPPLVGVAENVTEVPAQTGFEEALMAILTAFSGLTVIVIVLEVAGLPEGQPMFEVRIQVTASLLTGV
jgi:hypothetical protein